MYLLLSGEGVSDIGQGRSDAEVCEGEDFLVGPMAAIVLRIVDGQNPGSIDARAYGYVSKQSLTRRASELKPANKRKNLALPGRTRAKETRYFFNNARIFARIAMEVADSLKRQVVAVLFRDADGTASAGRGEWEAKRQSMLDGFEEERFTGGVPMVPKPKSEAWLLCAFKTAPYQSCDSLEERSGNDNSPNSLKRELERLLDDVTAESLRRKVELEFDVEKIQIRSFAAFRDRLKEVVERLRISS